MRLESQIHVYSFDTSCFYTDTEYAIHKKLVRLYSLRSRSKSKLASSFQMQRLNRLIQYFKEKLRDEFSYTRQLSPIRTIRPQSFVDRNVVSIFDSFLTRTLKCQINQLTKNIVIIQVYFFEVAEDLIKHGFLHNQEKYVLFSASAGQIRTKKFVMVKEKVLLEHQNTLMCGLTIDRINECGGINANKFLAYYALANSATAIWKEFDIDKSIVVEDWETSVSAIVDYIDDETYDITRKEMAVPIPHTDGCGMMIGQRTRMVRLPWIKGLLVKFDFHRFIRQFCGEDVVIKDIYGVPHNIIAENIQYIFTKSQFKMHKYYDNWEQYKEFYKKFYCTAGYTNDEPYFIDDAQINYQMLQSLRFITHKEMGYMARLTNEDINNIGSNFGTTMRLLGVNKYKENMNWLQKSLLVYPELLHDPYVKKTLKDVKQSLIREGKAGKLRITGKYTFVAPDLFGFCEWLFGINHNPKGLLNNGEVSCSLYKDGEMLDCLRSPHLYREHPLRINKNNDKTKEWFDTKCIYTSCHDMISKILQFDVDGDMLLVVSDCNFQRIVQRHMENIVPLYYHMKKALPNELNYDNLFQGLMFAYTKGNIGKYSNDISKIENSVQFDEDKALEAMKWLVFENNMCIDSAKTLYMPSRPQWVDEQIKALTSDKLPHFFIYAKGKAVSQVEKVNNSPVNMLDNIISNSRLRFNNHIGPMDVKFLLSSQDFKWHHQYQSIIDLYDYYNQHKYILFNHIDEHNSFTEELYVYQQIKKYLLELPFDKDTICDALVWKLYYERNTPHKKTLWGCFGEEIYSHIKHNLLLCWGKNIKICPVCGRRFRNTRFKYCSNTCRNEERKKQQRNNFKKHYFRQKSNQ